MEHRLTFRGLLAAVLLLAVGMGVWLWLNSRSDKRRSECLNNLLIVDSAIYATALENGLHRGAKIATRQIEISLFGHKLPSCSSGGRYVISSVGEQPVCSHHGDLLARTGMLNSNYSALHD